MELDKPTALVMLGSDAYYGVPEFQRDYVWRSETRVAEVDQLLGDLSTAFQEGPRDTYFLGSMVVFDDDVRSRRLLVDGQQRTVTLLLLLSAMRRRLRFLLDEQRPIDGSPEQEVFEELQTSLQLCTRWGMEREDSPLRFLFPDIETNAVLNTLVQQGDETLNPGRGGNRYFLVRASRRSSQFLADSYPALTDLVAFAGYVLRQVVVVMIKTEDLATAYRVFWTLNDRGRALSASDLLKNFLFGQQPLSTGEKEQLRAQWVRCTNTLVNSGEPTPDRFLRYFTIASLNLDTVVPARLLFNTIQEHRIEIGAGRPIELATRLSDSAQTYVALKRGERRTGVEVPSLTHIRTMAPTVTQPLAALLAVADRLQSTSGFTHICDALEIVTLVYGVTRERWNRFEVALPSITRGLRACNNSADLSAVGELLLEEHVRPRVNEFWRALDDVRNVPERTQRYLLAGVALYIQERSRASQYRALNSIMELSVEHILPQCALTESDSDGAAWRTAFGNISVDQAGSWVYRLGNLALLPTETNSRIGGKLFPVKAAAYQAEPLLLTQMIVTDMRVGRATGRREFAEEFDVQPTSSWNQSRLVERHELLKRLISLTWPLLPGAVDLTTSQ